jgi:hypothetical protein
MDRHSFHKANVTYQRIQMVEKQKSKLWNLKAEVVEILKGHTEIPEEEIYGMFSKIESLCKYLDKDIERMYQHIDKL